MSGTQEWSDSVKEWLNGSLEPNWLGGGVLGPEFDIGDFVE